VRQLNVFFDVDNTLIMWDGKLRNHAKEVFEQLQADGHKIFVWSGVGIRRWDMRRHKLDEYVEDYFLKPLQDHHEGLKTFDVHTFPDFVIDDHKSVVDAFEGYHISDMADPDDRELLDVLEAINKMASEGE
jgi:FMN phosphatase YigB (HAD superfamily)|tara:strand:+ start:12521 stop:12913 length:393 start_codon:yes stop_codon:yes gene_type:complete